LIAPNVRVAQGDPLVEEIAALELARRPPIQLREAGPDSTG
jgi:hypothetical protein